MAKGYWNVAGTITNPAGMGAYIQALEGYISQCGARFLCRDLNTDVREGNPGHLTVIIEFERLATAIAASESSEWQEMIKMHQLICDIITTILEEGDHTTH